MNSIYLNQIGISAINFATKRGILKVNPNEANVLLLLDQILEYTHYLNLFF